LLHCGPGLANGLANLHNARRAGSGIVNIVGDQATYHRPLDAPLTADTEGWARPVSGWVRTAARASEVGRDAAVAIQAARSAGATGAGQIATLVLPANTAWDEGGEIGAALPVPVRPAAAPQAIEEAARVLRQDPAGTLIVLAGTALRGEGLQAAHRIQAATGTRLLAQGSNARMERGRGRLPLERVPYPVDSALQALAGARQVILAGTTRPTAFFAYPNKPGYLDPAEAAHIVLTRPMEDTTEALLRLADRLGAPAAPLPDAGPAPAAARGKITPETFARTLAAVMPEGAVIADESVSFGRGFFLNTAAAAPHDWLQITGGAIGCGLPLATGAALGAPGRRVIGLQADGSAMYTLQALWTQARERLDVTTVLISNRKYAILLGELAGVGANPGRTALDMMDLTNPALNWVQLANGMGVDAARADTCEGVEDLLRHSFRRRGPFLIEMIV
jgi:acetolactate synthase-1/2/3 large subunit